MTRDEILAMEPGRELDALVMRIVFNAEKKDIGDECYWVSEVNGEEVCWPRWFSPSADIAAAWEVVEKLLEKGDEMMGPDIFCYKNQTVVIIRRSAIKVHAKTAPEAICKAALLAVMEG